jgi:hypothetical protein
MIINSSMFDVEKTSSNDIKLYPNHSTQMAQNLFSRSTKLVVGIKEWADDTLLKFASSYPLYISPDPKLGSREAEMFFPYNYNEMKGT